MTVQSQVAVAFGAGVYYGYPILHKSTEPLDIIFDFHVPCLCSHHVEPVDLCRISACQYLCSAMVAFASRVTSLSEAYASTIPMASAGETDIGKYNPLAKLTHHHR